MKRKILTNNEFLNMLDGILPENDRSKLIECYPEKDQASLNEQFSGPGISATDNIFTSCIYEYYNTMKR